MFYVTTIYLQNNDFAIMSEQYLSIDLNEYSEMVKDRLINKKYKLPKKSKLLIHFINPGERIFFVWENYNGHTHEYYMFEFYPHTKLHNIYTGIPNE